MPPPARLAVVPHGPDVAAPETAARRLQRLAQDLRREGLIEVSHLVADLAATAVRCAETSAVEPLPAGVRNALEKLGASLLADAQNLDSILKRIR